MGVRKCSRDMRLDVRHLHAVYLLDRRDVRQSVALTAVPYKVIIANGYLQIWLGLSGHVHQARGLELEVEARWRSITPLRKERHDQPRVAVAFQYLSGICDSRHRTRFKQ
jgi:hypothetical protein